MRVGIIGAGHMGRTHARLLAQDERVTIVGIADVATERAEALAHEVGGSAYSEPAALLDNRPDAIYVCTPNTLHTAAVLEALRRDIHVFSEKPMATSLQEAGQILDACRSSKGLYQVGHNRRFAPAYRFARQRIADDFLPYSANVKMNRGELLNPPWVSDRSVTGGFLYESTIHLLDMIRWLMGDVAEVRCKGRQSVYRELDDFSMILTFANGRDAVFSSCAHATWAFPFERIELYGEHASIVTEEMERVTYSPGLGKEIVQYNYFQLDIPAKWGYREEDRSFVDAILNGTPPAVTAEDGYKSVELVEACYRSASLDGQPVALPLAN